MNLSAILILALTASSLSYATEAPHDAMAPGSWSTGIKQFVGTSYALYGPKRAASRVWFSGAQGVLNEVYWPSIDTPQTRDSQFLVTDGHSFFVEERRDLVSRAEWIEEGVPAFRVVNEDPAGRFTIEKLIFTDPGSDVLLERVRITRRVPGLRFFVLHNANVGDTPMGNSASAVKGAVSGAGARGGLYAWQGEQAQALLASVPFKSATATFEGKGSAYDDIRDNFAITRAYDTATDGNVLLAGELALPARKGTIALTLALGFGTSVEVARAIAAAALARDPLPEFIDGWRAYQASVLDLSAGSEDGGRLFRSSIAVLKSMEDKQSEGAFVASPTVPWGQYAHDLNASATTHEQRMKLNGGYHLVWPRDLYQMATTFLAIGDPRTALACLRFLALAQYGPDAGDWEYGSRKHSKDGSFPQNAWVSGESYWPGLQLDEAALPIVLAGRLVQAGAASPAEVWDLVRRAGDFVSEYGPWSPMERWEETPGASPSNIAAEIAGLRAAAGIAFGVGDAARADGYLETASLWDRSLEGWLFTRTGPLAGGSYFIRIAQSEPWNPDDDSSFGLANGAGRYLQKEIVDQGFLELVRQGVRAALDSSILASLPAVDESIRVELPGVGSGFRRYTHDRYGYDDRTGAQTDGMLWPLLSGERGHYELELARERGLDARSAAAPWVAAIERMATPTGLIPEQVWDGGDLAGKPTGSATPLGWSHAEYVRLLRSRIDGRIY
jgi:glucoamylase